jgi:hypothetical protein
MRISEQGGPVYMKKMSSKVALVMVAAGSLLAAACGGGDGGGSSVSSGDFNKDPVNFSQAYYLAAFRVFTGATTADDMVKLFDESCRAKVNKGDLAKGLERSREIFPKLKGAKIEEIDFQGKAKVDKNDKGAIVTIPPPSDARVKVDGKFQNAFEYFKSVGLADEGDKTQTDELKLTLVNGRYYDADCENLTDIADAGKRG